MGSGYLLREVVDVVDHIDFTSTADAHTMASLYESMLKEVRDAAGDAGEFYTPRPVIRFMVQQIRPRLGEVILDPAAGTGGFLVEALEELRPKTQTTAEWARLQRDVRGVEKKPLPYLLGVMNLMLHGVENPAVVRDNALARGTSQLGLGDQVHVVLTNPPFGGEEEDAVVKNFPLATRTNETAILFLQVVLRRLKRDGRCAIVIPDGVLAADTAAGVKVKRQLLEQCNVHTVVRLPAGVFAPYTAIPSNLVFLEKGASTKQIWYYQLDPPEDRKNFTKTKPITAADFEPLQEWWDDRVAGDSAWAVKVEDLDSNLNLDLRNPLLRAEMIGVSPVQVATQLAELTSALSTKMREFEQANDLHKLLQRVEVPWPRRPMHQLVHEVCETTALEPGTAYKLLGVRLAGKGPFLREEKPGLEVKANQLNRVRGGQFIYSRLFAWRGAFGIVPEHLDGAMASNEFPTFEVNADLVRPEFLRLYFSRPLVWQEVERYCRGTTKASRNRFAVERFLAMTLPVPSLGVQDGLISEAEQVKELMLAGVDLVQQYRRLMPSLLGSFFAGEL